MKNIIIKFILIISVTSSWAQVGINTTNPAATLDVNGTVKIDDKIYLENPGEKALSLGNKLLINDTSGNIREYDINQSKYGPVNFVEMRFRDVSSYGLYNYDTKISIDDYLVNVTGAYFTGPGAGASPYLLIHSNLNDDDIEGQQIYAFKNTTTNTWFLRAYFPNSEFRIYSSSAGTYIDSIVDMYLALVIYRNNFIAKELPEETVDMGANTARNIAAPPGY